MLPHHTIARGAILSVLCLLVPLVAQAERMARHFHTRAIISSVADSKHHTGKESPTFSIRSLKRFFPDTEVELLTNGAAVVTFRRLGARRADRVGALGSSRPYSERNNACERPVVRRFLAHFNSTQCSADFAVEPTALPNDTHFEKLWGLNQTSNNDIDAPAAWDVTTGSRNVVIAIIDSGVKIDHPDLSNNIWVNPNEIPGNGIDDDGNGIVDDVNGYNAIDNDGNPSDGNGHGTHCAGTIGAQGNNGVGVAGVNWNVSLVPVKFIASNGSGSTADAIKAIDYVTSLKLAGHNVVASNNSWGGAGFSTALSNAITRAQNAGVLFVAAAGNSGDDLETAPSYPAAYTHENIIAVAAIGRDGELASYSNYGARAVDLAAPGGSAEGQSTNILSTYLNDGYAYLAGTSMAAPHVTGAAGLIAAAFPSLSATQIKASIINGARPHSPVDSYLANASLLNLKGALESAALGGAPVGTLNVAFAGAAGVGSIAAARRFSLSIEGGTPGAFSTLTFALDGRVCATSYVAQFDDAGTITLNGSLAKAAGRFSSITAEAFDDSLSVIASGNATISRRGRVAGNRKALRVEACKKLLRSLR